MPEQRLDALARTLAQSTARRSVMRGMAAVGGGLGALAFEPAVPPNAALTAAAPGGRESVTIVELIAARYDAGR